MGYLKYVKELWKQPSHEEQRARLLKARREPATLRLERPTNIARARSMGYRAKQGVIIIRQRLLRGGRMRKDIKGGRRSAHAHQSKVVKKSYQQVAEERAQAKYQNCEVLNSYKVLEDGQHLWYEVILLDRQHPAIKADPQLSGVAKQRDRAGRGLTSAGRKSRGLRKKGIGSEKNRPSLRSRKRLH